MGEIYIINHFDSLVHNKKKRRKREKNKKRERILNPQNYKNLKLTDAETQKEYRDTGTLATAG